MIKVIFKNHTVFLPTIFLLAIILGGLCWLVPDEVSGDAVTVSATVSETVACSTNVGSTAFNELDLGSVNTASPNATTTLSCNSASGCTLNIQDAGNGSGSPGLYKSVAPTHLIASASATLEDGTEGYGIQAATSSAGTGATLSLSDVYKQTGDAVGGLTTTNSAVASSSSPTANREVVVTHKAAISGLTSAGSYADTITYSCTGN